MESYTYNPLKGSKDVRYVRLMPASGGPIRCQIFRANLEDKTKYIALSYAWGSTNKLKSVICDGRSFKVTESLISALLRFRLPTEPRVFWIDAICINQQDIAERNHQVSLIREIYKRAQQLYIWLGPGDKYSTSAVDLMSTFAAAQRRLVETAVYEPCDVTPDQWQAFSKFLQRGWFERMWVIQELAMGLKMEGDDATVFLCGVHRFGVQELKDACEWCSQLIFDLETDEETERALSNVHGGAKRVLVLCDMTNHASPLSPEEVRRGLWRSWLLTKLADTRDKKATDPRDRLFAFYGFLHHEGEPVAVADYSKSVGTVFHEFAHEYIISNKTLDVLSEVEEPFLRTFDTKVPSWVPNWSVKPDRTPLLRVEASLGIRKRENQACGDTEPKIFSLNSHILLIDGIRFDEIATISEVLTQERLVQVQSTEDDPCTILDIWKNTVSHRDPYPGRGPAIEAYYKTLICGREEGDRHAQNFVVFWKSIQALPTPDLATFCVNSPEVRQLLSRRPAGAEILAHMHDLCDGLVDAHLDVSTAPSPISTSPANHGTFMDHHRWSPSLTNHFNNQIGQRPGHRRTLTTHLRYASSRRFRDLVTSSATGRVLFTTTRGYIGLGVAGTEVGDMVTVLSGGKTPFVLRKADITDRKHLDRKVPRSPLSGLKTYNVIGRLVGEAYVHGIMNGEAVKDGAAWDRIALV